ncbi:NAD(+) diphosphatase [Aestuariibius sp. HNIBRBA575]|uniref:NAD(+) diphosphatase n=1 Tax=Aestuariibius sp. HNIBRBA575 TaxID=3233343 RepID=UPI0034A1FBF6
MKIAETVTFGGVGYDRAAHIRDDDAALAQVQKSGDSRAIVLWRGKLLMDETGLVRVKLDHPALTDCRHAPLFLGNTPVPMFAMDISDWTPDTVDETELAAFLDLSEQVHPLFPDGSGFRELRANMTALSPLDGELAATSKAVLSWHKSHRFCSNCGVESVMAKGGWQRNCPSCDTPHFPRTDPVVIMLITNGNSVLMGRSPGWPEGMFSLLAGFVEPGETIEAAVRREVFEEVGVRVGAVEYLASQPWAFPSSLMIGCAGVATSTEITIDPKEIETAFWASRERVMDAMAGNDPEMLPAREGAIAHFLLLNWLADRLD